jgi:hypothetical protein
MAERSKTYEVGVTFCDSRNFKHGFTDLGLAMQEYADMLAVGVDPSLATEPDAKHVRMVTFLGFDELGQVVHHIYSPIFECEDRQLAPQ